MHTRALLAGENDADVVAATQQAAKMAEALGHEVELVQLPIDPAKLRLAYFTMVAAGTHAEVTHAGHLLGRAPRAADFEVTTWAFHRLGDMLSAGSMELARIDVEQAGYALGEFFRTHDVILTPTCARPPAKVGELYPDAAAERQLRLFRLPLPRKIVLDALERLAAQALGATPNTQLANLLGLPAISLPLGVSPAGLPVGTQWIAPFGREDVLFRLAGQLEAAHPWIDRRPGILESA